MAKKSLVQLKDYFKKGAYPTEAHFADALDSFRHKDDNIAVSDVEGLTDQLNGKYPSVDAAEIVSQVLDSSKIIANNKLEQDREFVAIRHALEELSFTGASGSVVLSGEEHVVGTFEDETGVIHNVYENIYSLSDLPETEATTKEYELSSEPLGFGRYIRVVSVEMVSSDDATFYFGRYDVDSVYVVEQKTKCQVRCIVPVSGCTKAILRMRYIKYMGDRLTFSLTLPAGVSAEGVVLSAAPLKYDKRLAFTYTADDSVVGAYARVWKRINRKWIDDVEFAHLNMEPTTGAVPAETLCVTDGCGNDRRFGFSCAIWPTWGNEYSPNGFIKDSSISKTNPYITWEELRMMVDYGVSLCFHNVDERIYDKNTPVEIAQGFVADNIKTYEKTGRYMKILGLPDGNRSYIDAAALSNLIVFARSSLNAANRINLHTSGVLFGQSTYGGINTSDVTAKLAELAAQHASTNPYWTAITSHRVSLDVMEMITAIYGLYGKKGDDSIWAASWDEIYEYMAMREGMSVKKTIDGQTVVFDVYVPSGRAFYFRELSFLVSGITSINGVTLTPLSDNIKGESHAAHISRWTSENVLLINMNFNANAVELAEKYVSRYEATANASDKEDAIYFVSMLLPSLTGLFTSRIDNVTPGEPGGLRLISASINAGATSTTNRATTLMLELSGKPTHYRVSESESLEGVEWLDYRTSNIPYMLSSEAGKKTVYVQLKDAATQSAVVSDTITLEASDTPVRIVLNAITINGGAASTASRDVTVAFNTNLTPTHYRIGEIDDLSSLSWVAYTGNVNYSLSQNNGQKTIYAQVQNTDGQSEIAFAAVTLSQTTTDSVRAIMSLGWDWSAGGSLGMTVFDATTQIGRIRIGAKGATYNIYDTNGNIVGAAVISGLTQTGSTNMGNTTTKNSGVYPDNVLKFSASKSSSESEGVVSMTLNTAGTYKFKIFINTKNPSIQLSGAIYALENDTTVQQYEIDTYETVDNFNNLLELTTTVAAGIPVLIKLSPGASSTKLLLINAIEIERI